MKPFCLRRRGALAVLLCALLALCLCSGCDEAAVAIASAAAEVQAENEAAAAQEGGEGAGETLDEAAVPAEDGAYSSPEEVAAYLHAYGHLPGNYITKDEAKGLGWDEHAGNLWDVAAGKSIGGGHYGNYEGGLPEAKGRKWRECDVNYEGGYRGAERLLYSTDGLIYYTSDHYNTFTRLY